MVLLLSVCRVLKSIPRRVKVVGVLSLVFALDLVVNRGFIGMRGAGSSAGGLAEDLLRQSQRVATAAGVHVSGGGQGGAAVVNDTGVDLPRWVAVLGDITVALPTSHQPRHALNLQALMHKHANGKHAHPPTHPSFTHTPRKRKGRAPSIPMAQE
jgi:hypothetical protein